MVSIVCAAGVKTKMTMSDDSLYEEYPIDLENGLQFVFNTNTVKENVGANPYSTHLASSFFFHRSTVHILMMAS